MLCVLLLFFVSVIAVVVHYGDSLPALSLGEMICACDTVIPQIINAGKSDSWIFFILVGIFTQPKWYINKTEGMDTACLEICSAGIDKLSTLAVHT